jgi:UDP-N-acetylmuramate dehydrogenase
VARVLVRHDIEFRGHTTLRVGGPPRRWVEVATAEEALDVVQKCDEHGDPLLVVGGGSNLVVSDAGFGGTALHLRMSEVSVAPDGDDVLVTCGAGADWDDLVGQAVDSGWSGVEALAGIPGTVGATPLQNVGAYGQEVASTVEHVDVWDRAGAERLRLVRSDCAFGYRTSRFKQQVGEWLVLSVTFRFPLSGVSRPVRYAELATTLGVALGAVAPAETVRDAVLSLRREKGMLLDSDDHDTWSAGSFFTNPVLGAADAESLPGPMPRWAVESGVKVPAAWLIEHAGFGRGFGEHLTQGRATLSDKHTLAVTNRGEASTEDVLAVARAVRDGVRDRFGVTLVPEPTLVGCHL